MPTVAGPTQMGPANGLGSPTSSVTVIVADENGANLGEQALVKLYSNMSQTNVWGTTQDRSQIIFDSVPPADYEVEVSAAGYETTTKDLNVMTAGENYDLIVRLKEDGSGAVTNPMPGQLLAPKARKEADKGISALNLGKLDDAEKHLQAAYKLAPGNADLNYLIGFLYLQRRDSGQAETYFSKAVSLNPRHLRALTMLGQLRLQQKDYAGAVTPLEQAVSADPEYWLSHWLLAEAYLRTAAFEKSRQEAELAVKKGKGGGIRAEVVKGESLASLGKRDEAIQAFQTFLKEAPNDPAAPTVREMIAQLNSAGVPAREVSVNAPAPLPASALGAPESKLSIPTWHPPSVDDERPAVSPGAVCPSETVIAGAGKRAKELVENVGRFEATEQALHEDLDETGKPFATEKRKFDYIASMIEGDRGLTVDEYLGGSTDQGDFPDHIATRGLLGLAMVFHPLLRDDFQMTCEGLGQWRGQATWLVYFRQRADRPSRLMRYEFTDADFYIALKGRAWIGASTFQIVHLEADLLNPIPKIQLLAQHQSVDYGPVRFKTKAVELWLPKNADLYFDFRHHRYHRSQTFADYRLFSVGANQRIGDPKAEESKNSVPKVNP
ncbi:MAG TPA: tetratricopeptide repeat protein [Candidatus Acidoferrum sp.]|nr:tetratricopeptide repeat protein [Candidatus Acidoferrum sp.]